MQLLQRFLTIVAIFAICVGNIGVADDWPMYGRDASHNAVSPERNPPTNWEVGLDGRKPHNILWTAPLGSLSFGDPVVANGQIWIGTNSVRSPGYDAANDASVLAGFNVRDGSSLFNYVSPRLPQSRIHDWPTASLACSPLIEGDLMWFTTNRCETVCLDLLPLKQGQPQPREVWKVDMMAEFGVYPIGSPMAFLHTCSIASFQDRIYVNTGNGFDYLQQKVPAPQAPSLICFDKHTGQSMWQDNSPGSNIFEGQWSSPLVVEVAGRPQLVMAQGDGWLRSFDPINGNLIWKFDVNPKTAKWQYNHGTRHQCLATPVFYQQHIYIATGQNGADGEGPGRLVCIDPSKSGDISSELAFDRMGKPLPDSRIQIADLSLGHRVKPNPNSGLEWECVSEDVNGDGEILFEEEFHLTYSNVVIKDNLLLVADFSGAVHCMDAQSGKRHWDYDAFAFIFSSPLIVGDVAYVADEDGDIAIFRLAADQGQPIVELSIGSGCFTSPIFSNGVLYLATRDTLYAIGESLSPNSDITLEIPIAETASSNRDRILRSVFVPTPQDIVDKMLELARVQSQEVVYDLGSGDGRVIITAAKQYGCYAVGYELDPRLVALSRSKATQEEVANLVTIEQADLFTANLGKAGVIALYLLPDQLEKLLPQLERLSPGARIVSHYFELLGLVADETLTIRSQEDGDEHKLLLYTVPLTKTASVSPTTK